VNDTHRHHGKIARITYNASAQILSGVIGEAHFNDLAYSGGSRGHKATTSAKAARYLHASNLNESMGRLGTTREIYEKSSDTYSQRGGTIPPGHYHCVYVANHPSFHACIKLEQMRDAHAIVTPFARHAIVHHRGGFFIHGHGPKGSDGCIVLASETRRKLLNQAVEGFQGRVVLEVTHVSYMLPAESEPDPTRITT